MPSRPLILSAAAVALLVVFPLAGCDREDQAEVEERLEKLGDEAEQRWKKAEPEIREGVRDAGQAVGKGIEAAGEVIQRGGEELQEEVRDPSESTLPDTVSGDTAVLR